MTSTSIQSIARIILFAVPVLFVAVGQATAADESLKSIQPFLKQHCFECHGAKKQENDKRFDSLKTELTGIESLQPWQGILDQLNLGEMPPEDKPQPAVEEIARVVKILTVELREAYALLRSTGGETVARRLNRFELRNTVRDLLQINDPDLRIGSVARLVDNNGNGRVENTSTDPFRSFPGDEEKDGFDNIGDRLVMSDFFLKLMLDAAEESLAMATETGAKPTVTTRRFAGHVQKQNLRDLGRFARELYPDYDAFYRRGIIMPDPIRGGVGTSARYRITVEVSAHNQKHPWGEVIPTDQDEPFLLNMRLFKSRTRNDHIQLAKLEVPGDGKTRTFTAETWIDKQWIPQVVWENGPTDREARTDLLMQKYLPEKFRAAPDKKVIPKEQHKQVQDAWVKEMAVTLLNNYSGPFLRIHSITLEPLIDQWPPQSHIALYGSGPFKPENVEPLLLAFAERAFRRPVAAKEVAPYVSLVRAQLEPAEDPTPPTGIQELTFKSYQGAWSKLPDFSMLKPLAEGPLRSGLLDLRVAKLPEHFGVVFEGKLNALQAGEYEFKIASDDGCRLIVDGKTAVEHDGLHGASTKKGKVQLSAGVHAIRVEYFAYGQPNSLQAFWSGPGFVDTALAVQKVAPPKQIDVDDQTVAGIKAMQVGYTAMMCSPEFLYLKEKSGRLDDFGLASRLSYFLWSSMPDNRLIKLAKAGKLSDAAVVQSEVDRMLNDPKAAAFTQHFTERWLRLDKLSESPPELNGPFRVYWDRKMEPQLVAQTNAYFADLVKTNGAIQTLIDSDYTYLNESIASVFYGRNDVKGDYLRKVATNDPRRGGVLTQPAVLTATANGVDTSPVVRGVWVLENILGTPPSPPPPDVEPLSPDLRAAKTIREQLAIHRDQEACNGCHRKIDPLGFALENFDPIGRWRERYPKGGAMIDPSTKMSTGREVADIVEFKAMLLERKQQVARCLAEKMLAYSSGRTLEPADRGEVDKIVVELEKRGNGLRDLIKLIVKSQVFLTK